MNKDLIGTGVALVTPFKQDGSVDKKGVENLVSHAKKNGVEYLVLMGTTAESVTLSKDEKKEVIDIIKEKNNGDLPLVLGIGGNNTKEVIHEIQNTNLDDYTAVLSVSPAYNRPNQEGIYQHFKAILENTDKDIILYNVPSRTGANVAGETTLKLAHEFSNLVAIKEASPNFLQSTEIIKDKPTDFMVLSGDDEFALPMVLAGGSGVISVIGQALPTYSEMIRLGLDRKVDEAYKLHYKNLEITRSIYLEGNPTGIKALLELQGVCNRQTRLPLVAATQGLVDILENLNNAL
ncbi:MAG: 4-hydroxy-tetrahydrodipicolinate synthase [Weeksellaceae bacterium]|nr:4-hydroxy-tetrahydrodipicolinate synthase [Weeksellaceae bacterium]